MNLPTERQLEKTLAAVEAFFAELTRLATNVNRLIDQELAKERPAPRRS